jgi:hypothetical protein
VSMAFPERPIIFAEKARFAVIWISVLDLFHLAEECNNFKRVFGQVDLGS